MNREVLSFDDFVFCRFRQQDSQEFLRYLLQGLNEDVSRIQRKATPMKIDEKAEEQKP